MSRWATRLRGGTAKSRSDVTAQRDPFYLYSYPKCGRTWLRFVVANYLVATFELDFEVDFATIFQLLPNDNENPDRGRPAYGFAHDERIPLILSRHAEYKPHFAGRSVFTIVRSPLDTLVSYYLQRETHRGIDYGSVQQFLRDPEAGVPAVVDYYNSWAGPLRDGHSLVLGYERMKADPREELRALWPFLGLPESEQALDFAIERSEFDRLRELEQKTQIPGLDYDVANPDARRVRRGKIGGWRDYLSEEDAEYVRERCRADLNDEARELLRPFWPEIL